MRRIDHGSEALKSKLSEGRDVPCLHTVIDLYYSFDDAIVLPVVPRRSKAPRIENVASPQTPERQRPHPDSRSFDECS